MVTFKNRLFATYTNRETNGLTEVPEASARGTQTFALSQAHAPGFPLGVSEHPYYLGLSGACGSWTGTVACNRLLLAQSTFGIIWDVSERGQFDGNKQKRFAYGLTKPVGMIYHPESDFVFVAESGTGCIKAVPNAPETDMRFIPPVVTGFKEPRCVRFAKEGRTMFVCDMSSCCVWRIELRRY